MILIRHHLILSAFVTFNLLHIIQGSSVDFLNRNGRSGLQTFDFLNRNGKRSGMTVDFLNRNGKRAVIRVCQFDQSVQFSWTVNRQCRKVALLSKRTLPKTLKTLDFPLDFLNRNGKRSAGLQLDFLNRNGKRSSGFDQGEDMYMNRDTRTAFDFLNRNGKRSTIPAIFSLKRNPNYSNYPSILNSEDTSSEEDLRDLRWLNNLLEQAQLAREEHSKLEDKDYKDYY